ncbi:MAG: cyclodeaminase/cyclohydrolase family protein [Heliobacteriaceae bacterium]|nr:cyclodeaminase/cyclohydrolase family protein [Heliobacteriaceae bacterium]MDD4587347.1 cyclodeaminase/cyclohydrolase family protein [Heliobacteriaceae bacterium]
MGDIFAKAFREVIAVSASSQPTPGGGSVSAMTGSFAAAMVAMVANLTVGKEKFKDVEPQVQGLLTKVNAVIGRLEDLVRQDMAAFAAYMAVFKLPKETAEEKAARAQALQDAAKEATEVPLAIAEACLAILQAAAELAPIGNKMAISDAGVGAYLAEASLKSALLSVDINLPVIKDAGYVAAATARRDALIAEAGQLKDKAVTVVAERLK